MYSGGGGGHFLIFLSIFSLRCKLQAKEIDGRLLQLLDNYLMNCKMRVVLSGAKSNWHTINTGVPQGSILGPLMFLIYADDMVEELECDIHLYADDALLIANYRNHITAIEKNQQRSRKTPFLGEQVAHVFQPREDKIHVDILNKPATTETAIKRG